MKESKLEKQQRKLLETGKIISDKVSMMKRDKWLKFLAEKSGVTLS